MQQIKSYWRVVAVAGVAGAFIASACVVTTTDGTGGAGGTGATGGTSTSSGGTAGTSSTAGTSGTSAGATSMAGTSSSTGGSGGAATGGAGAVPFQCDPANEGGAAPGTPNTCVPDDAHKTDACALCVQSKCCTAYADCYATDPGNQCGWGGPNDGGEIACIQECIQKATSDGGPDDADLRGMCFDSCATTKANKASQDCGLIGNQTNALFGCLSDNCATECLGG